MPLKTSISRPLALAVLAAQLLAFGHFAAVVHVTCAEHGELVHPSRSSGAAAWSRLEEGHDRCLLALDDDKHAALLVVIGTAIVPDDYIDIARHHASSLCPPSIALLLLAPKNGPPARVV